MEASWAAGVRWVECDVWASADCVPVVIHDATLDRTTDLTGAVAGRTWDELSGANLRDAAGRVTEAKLPTLERMLSRMPLAGAMMIEIKSPDDRKLVGRVISLTRDFPGRWTIQSFDERNMAHARDLGLGPELGLLVEGRDELAGAIESPWAAVRMDWQLASVEIVHELKARGKQVGVWTVNEAADIANMARLGVDQIITDEPIVAMKVLADLK
jgi:glycerophosphoryl diester phosphodiesterase